MWEGYDDVMISRSFENAELLMKITLKILKILIYFFLKSIMVWGALLFNNENTNIYFDLTCSLMKIAI